MTAPMAAADGAAAGHGDAGHAGARDERAEHERAGAHRLDDLVLGNGVGEHGALDVCAVLGAAIAELHFGAHADQQLAFGFDVLHLRDVFKDDFVLGENGCGHAGERGVLRAGDLYRAEQGIAPAYYELVHRSILRRMALCMLSAWIPASAVMMEEHLEIHARKASQ
jgi:hypothetical protein